MSENEIAIRVTLKDKALIVLCILLVFLFIVLPVWQIGSTRTYEEYIRLSKEKLQEQENRIRELQGDIAIAKSPEALIDHIVRTSASYEEINADSVRIARSGL